jgi:hypothetical protein
MRCKDVNQVSMDVCTPLGQLLGHRNGTHAEIDRYRQGKKAAYESAMVSIGSPCSLTIVLLLFSFGLLHFSLRCAAISVRRNHSNLKESFQYSPPTVGTPLSSPLGDGPLERLRLKSGVVSSFWRPSTLVQAEPGSPINWACKRRAMDFECAIGQGGRAHHSP